MTLEEAMKERHTVRKYTDKEIPVSIVSELEAVIQKNNDTYGLAMELRINDTSAFNTIIKLILAKGVKNFLILSGPDTTNLDEKLGYCGADFMLHAQTLGLNTWWVGGTFNRGKLNSNANGNRVIGVIAVGYGATQGKPHKSKSYPDIASFEGEAPKWFQNGIEAALLAPTALNKQEFSITGKKNKVNISCDNGIFTGADLGLVKYHFELGAGKDNFQWDKR